MTGQCVVIRAGAAGEGPTGVTYAAGISSATVGARGLCLQLASLPPRARAHAHHHDRHEAAAYVLDGQMVPWSGDRLEHKLVAGPGDFIYIPPGVPHLVINGSAAEPTVAVITRNDGNEQEDVTELPGVDALPHPQLATSR